MDTLNHTVFCAVALDLDSKSNDTELAFNKSEVEIIHLGVTKAASFGAVTGILIALLVDFFLSIEYDKLGSPTINIKLHKLISAKTLTRTIALCILIATMPIVALLTLLAFVYKLVCMVIIIIKDERCASFLDSFDVFWSLEDDTSKSIITVLGFIEAKTSQDVIDKIKEKLKTISQDNIHSKIFYRKTEDYGFYYWQKFRSIDIDQYVQSIEILNGIDDISREDLENAMTAISSRPLPYGDQGLFQIIVTNNSILNKDEAKERQFGIIFRIHHSVGDGVSLLNFLRVTLADPEDESNFNISPLPVAGKSLKENTTNNLLDMMMKLLTIPVCFVDGIIRKPDQNNLHGPVLTGKKIFTWTDSDEDLLKRVKDIKNKVADLTFSEVLVLGLSSGLQKFFSQSTTTCPDDVAVVLPVRCPNFSSSNKANKLENDFSVTILDLPIQGCNKMCEVKKRCDNLRKSADPITNYYFLKLVGYVLPKNILEPLLNSSQATMVFSNLPGPGSLRICGGNALDSLVFFVPHKGTTGLGITALSYGGKLRFAAMADTALVPDSKHLALILDGMVEEITRLHQKYVQ